MPNTALHVAAHLALTPRLGQQIPRGWWLPLVALGAVLPDTAWILQRLVRPVLLSFDGNHGPEGVPIFLDLRLVAGIQSSFGFVLLLALAASCLTRTPRPVFLLLAWGAAVHLALDALQIKWANGVLWLAPFDWSLQRLDWLWPEAPPMRWASWLATLSLPLVLLVAWRGRPTKPLLCRTRLPTALALLLLWFLLPLALIGPFRAQDPYSVRTLSALERGWPQDRAATEVEFGRATVVPRSGELFVRTMSERLLPLQWQGSELPPDVGASVKMSIRGTLAPAPGISPRGHAQSGRSRSDVVVQVAEYRTHPNSERELLTVCGLLATTGLWIIALFAAHRAPRDPYPS